MTDVAIYETRSPALPDRAGIPGSQDFDSWVQVAAQVIKLADHIFDTPFVPEGLRGSAPAVAAAMLAGREMGLGPMTSLANIDVIRGRPAPKPVLMRGLVLARGHKWVDVDVSDVRVVIKGCRKGESEWTEVTFTAAQAKQAGIDLGKYPADKLYARASSRLARRKFADVIMGMPYSADEIEDGEDENGTLAALNGAPQPAPAPAIEPRAPQTAQRRSRRAQAAPSQSPAPGPDSQPAAATPAPAAENGQPPLPGEDDPPAPEPAGDTDRHKALVGIVQQHFTRLGIRDRNARLLACEKLAQTGPLDSSKDLTVEQLSVVADVLARCRTRENLDVLLVAGEKPESQGPGEDGGGDD